jgi:hypothetical protein
VNDSVDPVELSPTRDELVARVQRRGRQLRARRRVGVTAVTALVVLAIAVPAIAIGTRSSSSRPAPPATAAPGTGDFRIALVEKYETEPLPHFGDPCWYSDGKGCYVLGRTLVTARDVRDAKAVYDSSEGWWVDVTLDSAAVRRLSEPVGQTVAIVVAGEVQSAPKINPGITGTVIQIHPARRLTHAEAIALADRITGKALSPNQTAPALTARIELPGDTFVAGAPVHGTLIVENDTGNVVTLPRDSNGCRIPWVVELTNYGSVPVAPPIVRSVCLPRAVVLTPGASEFAFTLLTAYSNCTPLKPVGDAVACLPGANRGPPPLPPGDYTAVLQPVGVFPTPPPVTVHLVSASAR